MIRKKKWYNFMDDTLIQMYGEKNLKKERRSLVLAALFFAIMIPFAIVGVKEKASDGNSSTNTQVELLPIDQDQPVKFERDIYVYKSQERYYDFSRRGSTRYNVEVYHDHDSAMKMKIEYESGTWGEICAKVYKTRRQMYDVYGGGHFVSLINVVGTY